MTYINTKTPTVAKPRSEAREYVKPLTELAYLSAYDALCKREGRVGKLPVSNYPHVKKFDINPAIDAILGAIKCNVVRSADMAEILGWPKTRTSYVLDYMRKRGMIQYDASKLQWSVK